MIVWDVRTGKELRSFDKDLSNSWPAFKWSFNGRYLARITEDTKAMAVALKGEHKKNAKERMRFLQISVYETPHMGLLEKKSLKVEGVQDCQWSPSQSIIAYWVPERDNIPARVALVEIPSRKIVREKHFYGVSDVRPLACCLARFCADLRELLSCFADPNVVAERGRLPLRARHPHEDQEAVHQQL